LRRQPLPLEIVVFWALIHFSREEMVPTINYLQRLDSYGIAFPLLGRPRIDAAIEQRARKMLASGTGIRKVASTLGAGSAP
jgi:hypothetical protein